jgi:hypothetical protein
MNETNIDGNYKFGTCMMIVGKIGCLNYERKNRSHMQVAGYVGF